MLLVDTPGPGMTTTEIDVMSNDYCIANPLPIVRSVVISSIPRHTSHGQGDLPKCRGPILLRRTSSESRTTGLGAAPPGSIGKRDTLFSMSVNKGLLPRYSTQVHSFHMKLYHCHPFDDDDVCGQSLQRVQSAEQDSPALWFPARPSVSRPTRAPESRPAPARRFLFSS